MAWRVSAYLIEGELDNTQPGKVTGWMRFAGMKEQVTFDLKGDFPSPAFGRNQRRVERRFSFDRRYGV